MVIYYGQRLEYGNEGRRIITDIGKSRSELEDIQRESRAARYPYDIYSAESEEEIYEGKPTSGYITPKPDIQAQPQTTSQNVVDVQTGQNVPYRESSQSQFEQNLELARQQNKISPSSAEELRKNYYDLSPTAQQYQQQQINQFVSPISQQLKADVQTSLFAKQQQIQEQQTQEIKQPQSPLFFSGQNIIQTVGEQYSYQESRLQFRPATTLEQQYTPQGRVDVYKPQEFKPTMTERLVFKSTFGTPTEQLIAEFGLGVQKAKEVPTLLMAGGFAGLRAFAPKLAGGVGIGAMLFSVKPLQEEIAKKGLTKTIAYELPTLGLFIGAERTGAGLRQFVTTKADIPINLRFAQAAELKSVQTEQGKIIRINPVDFVAQVDKTKFAGRGVGKAIITEEGKLGATFQYQLETPKIKESITGVKGLVKETPEGFKSLSIYKQFSEKGNEIKRGITYSRTQEVIGGEFPRYASKTIEFAPKLEKGELQPITGASSILKKEFEITAPNFAGQPTTIETYTFFEKGTSAENIARALPETKITKPPKASLPVSYGSLGIGTETLLKTTGKEAIVSGEFISGLKQTIKKQISKTSFGEFARVKPRIIATRVTSSRIKQQPQQQFQFEIEQEQRKQQQFQFPFSLTGLENIPISQTIQLQQPRTEITSIPKPLLKTIASQKIGIQHFQSVSQGLRQDVRLIPPSEPQLFKTPRPETPFPKIPAPSSFLELPPRRKFKEEDGFGFFKKSRRKSGFTPSLVSEEFGIIAKSPYAKLSKKTFSGLEIRGLPREIFKPSKSFRRKRR